MGIVSRLPRINADYWLTLAVASIFGTNTGDFVANSLQFGHLAGLPYLALLFGAILLLARWSPPNAVLCFWAAIITMRTAATNVGDAFHDFGIAYKFSIPIVLAVFAASVLLYRRGAAGAATEGTVRVNRGYWGCMMLAGILGTIGGDFASFRVGLTPAGAALAAGLVALAAVVWFGRRGERLSPVPYWAIVALIRTAGTAAGDAFADALGLSLSTALTGLVFAGLVLRFYGSRSALPAAVRS